MQRGNKWVWLVWGVVLLCYLVPYTLLTNVQAWYGSFLFWTVAGLAVIVLNVLLTRNFREDDRD